jgi:hypothetical protein
VVEGLASYVMDAALDPLGEGVARRCGAIRTAQVSKRTTVLLIRARYHIVTLHGGEARPLLAEECLTLAFAGAPDAQRVEWLASEAAEQLLQAKPDANIAAEQATDFVRKVLAGFEHLRPHLDEVLHQHGAELLEAHKRVREAARLKGVRYRVEPQLPPDVLGVYVYLPVVK